MCPLLNSFGSGEVEDQVRNDLNPSYIPAIGAIALVAFTIAAVYFVKKKCNIENAEDDHPKTPVGYNYGPQIDREDMIVDIIDKSKLSSSPPGGLPTIREEVGCLNKKDNDKHHIPRQRDTEIYI